MIITKFIGVIALSLTIGKVLAQADSTSSLLEWENQKILQIGNEEPHVQYHAYPTEQLATNY
jgi:hypothetical protein